MKSGETTSKNAPHAQEFNLDVYGECFLELGGLLPANVVMSGIHLVCERYLLEVASREKTDFVKHSSKTVKIHEYPPLLSRVEKDADLLAV